MTPRPSWLRRAREDDAAIGVLVGLGCGAVIWGVVLALPWLLARGLERCPTCTRPGLIAFWVGLPIAVWAFHGPPPEPDDPPTAAIDPAPLSPPTSDTPHDGTKVPER